MGDLIRRRSQNRSFCAATYRNGRQCGWYAGEGTTHEGYGLCANHIKQDHEKVWKMAFELAQELDITPWEAMIGLVKLGASRVKWIDEQLKLAIEDNDESQIKHLQKESRAERRLLGQTSKAAIDAGVAERMIQEVEADTQEQVQSAVRGILAAIDALGLSDDDRRKAIKAAQDALFDKSSVPVLTLNGKTIDPNRRYIFRGEEVDGSQVIMQLAQS